MIPPLKTYLIDVPFTLRFPTLDKIIDAVKKSKGNAKLAKINMVTAS